MDNEFDVGQKVFWLYTIPRGWNETVHVHAEIISVTAKRAKIKAFKPDGSHVERTVKIENIIPVTSR